MFVDEEKIEVMAGNGGDGVVHFRREKFLPKGGPDGGDGGSGGDIVALCVRDINVLQRRSGKRVFKAENGRNGKGKEMSGKDGEDLKISFPIGSIITNLDTGEVFELLKEGDTIILAAGGEGGLGNIHFKSSRNTTPMQCTKGQVGQSYNLHIEVKLIAEYGLIGLPSSGKSTLLNMITNAHSKVGAYPFTTLEPHLGVLEDKVIADVPGIIEGAESGKGLGIKFLKHIQRTKKLIHLVSLENDDVLDAYNVVRKELEKFDKELLKNEELIVLTKKDLFEKDDIDKKKKDLDSFGDLIVISKDDEKSIDSLIKKILK